MPPTKPLDLKKIEELATLGMSGRSIAARVGVSEATLRRRCDAILQKSAAIREEKLLRAHQKLVDSGNVAAVIFALKALLGWSESGPATKEAGKAAVLKIIDVNKPSLKAN